MLTFQAVPSGLFFYVICISQGAHLIQVNQDVVIAYFCPSHIHSALKLKKIEMPQMLTNRCNPWGIQGK